MTIVSVTHSQSSDSSKIWIPRQDAVRVLKKAAQATVLEERLQVAYSDISILGKRILEKDLIIQALKEKDSTNREIIKVNQREKEIMVDQRRIFEAEIKSLEKNIKRERLKTKLTLVFGVLGVIGALLK